MMDGVICSDAKMDTTVASTTASTCRPPQVDGGHNQLHHRRSRSASEKNVEVQRILQSKMRNKDHQTEMQMMSSSPAWARRSHVAVQSPLREFSSRNDPSNHRASLEKDVELLQLRLQEERSMRLMLERAMGRASSTLSPGHRHFASQTKELIAEIELLEQEVTNREQHVLTLYRTIFDQCVTSTSRATSQQSSNVASPSHPPPPAPAKHLSSPSSNHNKKHPRIISSAFCSSKLFPLRPLQSLVSINGGGESGKRPSSRANVGASTLFGRKDNRLHKSCSSQVKVHQRGAASTLVERSVSIQQKTLKDHLDQCPSKLSEEMVKCMAAVYCWLCSSSTPAGANPSVKGRSPLLSRSSTNVVLPRRGNNVVNGEQISQEEEDWSCKSTVEVCWISTDKSRYSCASYAIDHYRVLVEQLETVTVTQMGHDAQVAFWINVYNSLVMHAYLAYGIPHSSLRRLALFHKVLQLTLPYAIVQAAYNIGGHIISANSIEHSIFCFRTPRVGKWLETILSTALRKKSSEERQLLSSKFGLSIPLPLACFALCTGTFSDPVLKVYTSSNVKEELEAAKKEFLQSNVVVKKSKKVFLPKLLERFAKEASMTMSSDDDDDLIKWVVKNVDKKLGDSIEKCAGDRKLGKKQASKVVVVEWLPYSSRFRYVFSKDLTEKPWWV
ncbi:unnamed protein product [Linum tenue]|uniref:Electron transporter n=1 Tax=Linum tenue TaxID=586396 RepID=A0AAV0JV13_9ROSI|nr:unnamed protein product [Linum tenue]